MLVDAGNAPLGMLIGGTNDKSFFIPISRIKVAANGLIFVDF